MNNTKKQKENARVVLDMLTDIYPDRLDLGEVYVFEKDCGTIACVAGHLAANNLLGYEIEREPDNIHFVLRSGVEIKWKNAGLTDFGHQGALLYHSETGIDRPLHQFAKQNGFRVDDMDRALYRFGRLSGMTDAECFALAKKEMVKS